MVAARAFVEMQRRDCVVAIRRCKPGEEEEKKKLAHQNGTPLRAAMHMRSSFVFVHKVEVVVWFCKFG